MKPFHKLLIANRGEVVTRVARSAHQLGLRTVAVASDADRGAPFTASCDRVVAIGGAHAADSYLRIDKIIAAARTSGAQAVHPGYGFLSESAELAEAVEASGLVWIGPPPQAMRAMADKAEARTRMAAAGVPVLPGYDGADQSRATFAQHARQVGYPLMVKAAAGGGGRGMRRVADESELDAALASAAAEAHAAFGDARPVASVMTSARRSRSESTALQHAGALTLSFRFDSAGNNHCVLTSSP